MLIVVQIWAAVLLLECQVSLTVCYLTFLCLSNWKKTEELLLQEIIYVKTACENLCVLV